ncbi:MAG: hypothetical protein ACTSQX_10920 [Candidatus Heimdallarchaeota archaeon]
MFRRQPKKKKGKTLWTEYPEYNPINNIEEKPLFDETRVNEEHRVLGQIIRENWDLVHPLAKDYLLSSATEWRSVLSQIVAQTTEENVDQSEINILKRDYELKIQNLLIEKEADIEKIKEQVASTFIETLETKDQELAQYKMLADSVTTTYDSSKISKNNLETEIEEKERKIRELDNVIDELKEQCKTQEIEAMGVQTGISKNFQTQINDLTKELYERQEQIEKLRTVLTKAKDQLVALKEQNNNNTQKNDQLLTRVETLERMITERDTKLRQVYKAIGE